MPTSDSAPLGILGYDPLGPTLAGPARRAWALASACARVRPVEFWYEGTPPASIPANLTLRAFHPELLCAAAESYAGLLLPAQAALRDRRLFAVACPRIIDCYDPFPLETAALLGGRPRKVQAFRTGLGAWASLLAVGAADYWVVANAAQCHYLGGLLVATGRMSPARIADPNRVLTIPAGLDPAAATLVPASIAAAKGLRAQWGIPAAAPLILWTGGLWPWMDPLGAVRAFLQLATTDPAPHLVLAGFDTAPAGMQAQVADTQRAIRSLLRESPDRASRVHLVSWIPAATWPAVAGSAQVHLSAHHSGWEAALSHRTRYLEAILHGIPLVATTGDPLGTELAARSLAEVAPPGDPAALATVLAQALEPTRQEEVRTAAELWRKTYAWEEVAAPLINLVQSGPLVDPERTTRGAVDAWLATFPIPEAPGPIERLMDRVRRIRPGRL